MIKFINKNYKLMIGIIIGAILSGFTVYGATIIFNSDQVGYDNNNTNLQINNADVDNVQDAIDAIYNKVNSFECATGFNKDYTTTYTYDCINTNIPSSLSVIYNSPGLYYSADEYRFVGVNPDNYVTFNNETWRIVGIYGGNLKIIRSSPMYTSIQFDTTSDTVTYASSSLKTKLNGDYYNSLSSTAKNMIETKNWYHGPTGYIINAPSHYTQAKNAIWSGNVGLIAGYEYLYAAASNNCLYSVNTAYINDGCVGKNWLYSVLTSNGTYNSWTINDYSDGHKGVIAVKSDGLLHASWGGDSTLQTGYKAATPVVYLKSTVSITGGNGTIGEPYTLS